MLATIIAPFYYSSLYADYSALFLTYSGTLLSAMTAQLNLKSSARMKYNPLYGDPFAFAAILYVDANGLASPELLKAAYVTLLLVRVGMYIAFMRSVIVQVCDHLKIPFLTIVKKAE